MPLEELEKSVLSEINIDNEWALLEHFLKLVRVSGSEDERKAATYIYDKLRGWGIDAKLYEPNLYISAPVKASFQVTSPMSYSPRHDDIAMNPKTSAFSATGTYEGEIVYVPVKRGEGISSFFEVAAAEKVDAKGKAVLVEGMLLPRVGLLAEELGAKAVVAIAPGKWTHEGIMTSVWGTPTEPDLGRIPKVVGVSISNVDGQKVEDFLKRGRVTVRVSAETNTRWVKCPIPVAEIRNPASKSEEFVLLHGHYDSWHVGIGDNAVGNAVKLEVARCLHRHRDKLNRGVKVAWWPGHSTGRYAGSTWFADNFGLELERGCVAQINCDSPGCKDATEYSDVMWTDEAEDFGKQLIRDAAGKEAHSERPVRAGDYSFHGIGITSLFMLSSTMPEELRKQKGYYQVGGCGGNIEWHTEHDDMQVADRRILEIDTRLYLLTVFRLSRATTLPFDFRRTVGKSKETISGYQTQAGSAIDLSPVIKELDGLRASLDKFYARIQSGRISAEEMNSVNRTIMRVARVLIPVSYTWNGKFKHDPALEVPAYPDLAQATRLKSLQGDALLYEALRAGVVRGINRVSHAVMEARREVDESLAKLG